MVKKIKRNNFEGGFVVTGKGDNAVLTPKTVKPKTKPKFTRPKKEAEPEEQPKGIFTHPDGWYWYKNTPLGRLVTHIKVGKIKYNVLDKLGQGKDGVTYYCNHAEMGKTIIKILHPYGRKYWHRYETIRHRIQAGDLKNESIIKQLFRWPQDGQKGPERFKGDKERPPVVYLYKCKDPYTNFQPVEQQTEWLKGLIDICLLQEALLTEEFAVWDLGFKSGLNYMLDEEGKTVWVDFGGNAFAVPKESNRNIFNRWVKFDPKEDYQTKPQLGALTSNMLRWYFLLHLEYHHRTDWNIHDLNFISSIASSLQTSSRFEDFLDPKEFHWKFDLIKIILHESDGLNWTKPKTWETVRATLERYIATRES